MAKKLTSAKARKILHDKEVHGHPLTEQQRKFFGAIAGGAKPYKAQNGIEGTMGGLTDIGFNYNGAWGGTMQDGGWLDKYADGGNLIPPMAGANTSVSMAQLGDSVKPIPMQLAMGGSLPGAVGFMYARTQSPAPSNGPYAKKTKASAQDGENIMKGREYVEQWMNSPMYKEMLEKSAHGPELERISKGRISNLTIPTNVSTDISLRNTGTLGQTQHRIRTMFNATVPERDEMIKILQTAVDNPKDKEAKRKANEVTQPKITGWNIGLNPKLKPGTIDYESILAHEYGHTTDNPFISKLPHQTSRKEAMSQDLSPYIPKSDIEKMQSYYQGKVNDDLTKYVSKPQETRQYLNDIRYLGKSQGVYDPFTQKITPEQYRKIKPTELSDPAAMLRNIYTDEQIIDMLNSISKRQQAGGVPVAQNGQEMKFYQAGLDFTPKTISQDGSKTLPNVNAKRRKPIIVSDPKDPRLKAYRDSLSLHNLSKENLQVFAHYDPIYLEYPKGYSTKNKDFETEVLKQALRRAVRLDDYDLKSMASLALSSGIRPQGHYVSGNNPIVGFYAPSFKKPEQPVVYQSEPEYKPRPRIEAELPRTITGNMSYDLPKPKAPYFKSVKREDKPTKFSFTYPTGGYNEQKTMYFPSKSALKSFTQGVRGASYQEGDDYATATGNLQDGGDIPVDPMGYWNPENVGNPVIIPSNIITMEGVDQPLLGISNTGDVQYMEPGEEYEFDGEYVTEYPVAKGGVSVNNADAQPVKKLDQLLNFTNYNKPTKGGWLDKYN